MPMVPQSAESMLASAFAAMPHDSVIAATVAMPVGSSPSVRVNLQGQTVPGPRRIISSGANANICKIADPDCESCQA